MPCLQPHRASLRAPLGQLLLRLSHRYFVVRRIPQRALNKEFTCEFPQCASPLALLAFSHPSKCPQERQQRLALLGIEPLKP